VEAYGRGQPLSQITSGAANSRDSLSAGAVHTLARETPDAIPEKSSCPSMGKDARRTATKRRLRSSHLPFQKGCERISPVRSMPLETCLLRWTLCTKLSTGSGEDETLQSVANLFVVTSVQANRSVQRTGDSY